MRKLKRIFLQGLLVSLPAALTGYILLFILKTVYDYADFALWFLPREVRSIPYWALIAQTCAVVISTGFVILVGMAAKTILGRFFQTSLNALMISIPIIRSIYGPMKQIVEVIFSRGDKTFSRPVIVPFPYKGKRSIGFMTGTAAPEIVGAGQEYLKVFVPTVPNPTSGFLLFFKKEDVTFVDMSAEEALRLILSGGILQ